MRQKHYELIAVSLALAMSEAKVSYQQAYSMIEQFTRSLEVADSKFRGDLFWSKTIEQFELLTEGDWQNGERKIQKLEDFKEVVHALAGATDFDTQELAQAASDVIKEWD